MLEIEHNEHNEHIRSIHICSLLAGGGGGGGGGGGFTENGQIRSIKKQRPIQRRKVLNLCTIFRLAKLAFFRYNGKLHWEGFYM